MHYAEPQSIPAKPPVFVGSDVFRRAAFGANHPLRIMRHSAVLDMVRILGWLRDEDLRIPAAASVQNLTEFHDSGYVEALQYADSTGKVAPDVRERYNIGTLENPLFDGVFERAATTVGGSILAAELALAGHVAFHPSGGTHHGRRDRASGFCYFNDPVFAILALIERGCERILYVDLDAHHGDGVEEAFVAERRVMTVSIHEQDRWPYSGAASDRRGGGARNFPVLPGFNDSELFYLVEHAVMPIAGDFGPDALVLCCGADSLAGDPLSSMQLSNAALWDTVERLLAFDVPSVVLGGGGYNPWTVCRYWSGLWGRLQGFAIPEHLPAQAVDLLRSMECELVDEDDVDPRWLDTLVDTPNDGPVRPAIKSLATRLVGN